MSSLQEYLTVTNKEYFNLVKASKKLAPDAEALLKEAILRTIREVKAA